MSLQGGRGRLYGALQALQARWDRTDPHWQDTMKAAFVEQVLTPLQEQTFIALEAIDQMDTILHAMRRECEGSNYDIHGDV
jgi:hypothetical protein